MCSGNVDHSKVGGSHVAPDGCMDLVYLIGRKIDKTDEADLLWHADYCSQHVFFFPEQGGQDSGVFFLGGVRARPQKKLPKKQVSAFSTVPCLRSQSWFAEGDVLPAPSLSAKR